MIKHNSQVKSRTVLLGIISISLLLILGAAAVIKFSQQGGVLQKNGAPRLSVDVEEINLGDIPVGQSVKASFRLTNTGNQTLKFREAPYIEVKEGC
jgi:hypothetical protein